MLAITRRVDQWVQIGQSISVSPTDIDEKTVRLIARGRVLGGAQVGGRADELGVGGHGQDAADPLEVLGGHVLQALDELSGREVRADLVLGPRGELLDRRGGGGHLGVSPVVLRHVPTCDT